MAGGRRPASYVAGARHNTGVDRVNSSNTTTTTASASASPPQTVTPLPSSLSLDHSFTNGTAILPPWIPSIWQPSSPTPIMTNTEQSQKHQQQQDRTSSSDVLAAALESAVQGAVLRIINSNNNGGSKLCGVTEVDEEDEENNEKVSRCSSPSSSCQVAYGIEREQQQKLAEKEHELEIERLKEMRKEKETEILKEIEVEKQKIRRIEIQRQNERNETQYKLQRLEERLEKYDMERRRSEQIQSEQTSKFIEKIQHLENKIEILEQNEKSNGKTEEEILNVRGKLSKQEREGQKLKGLLDEANALNEGYHARIREEIEGIRKKDIKGLKKLIEINLRNQVNAESIVKDQVSLITKHVCMAMRQYTSRRISENNVLIDKALMARVPDYQKNQDRFVLVREESVNGDDVDIKVCKDDAEGDITKQSSATSSKSCCSHRQN